MKSRNEGRLLSEYRRLVTGLATEGIGTSDMLLANPVLPQDLLHEAVPGNIRKAEHFVSFVRRFLEYVKVGMSVFLALSLCLCLCPSPSLSSSPLFLASHFPNGCNQI